MDRKDIYYLDIRFFEGTGKQPIRLDLCNPITRKEALELIDIFEDNPLVFQASAWTNKNTYI